MEYDGGCTATAESLEHEAYHSWWGRGVKPAAQRDGWWDEAWNVYHDNGGAGVQPYDFTEPPVQLSPRNPYSRVTPSAAYSAGERFFAGAAALTSPAALTAWMGEFYRAHLDRPVTTEDLEAHLVARSGAVDLVDAFHRWVYGLGDPSPAPDLWLRDDPGHTGSERWDGRFWDSPDLWIRHRNDGGTTHQEPIAGRDNWFHASVRNRGAGDRPALSGHLHVKQFAGVQFVWPTDFLPAITAAAGFELDRGRSGSSGPLASRPCTAGRYPRLLARRVLDPSDRPVSGRHVWEHGNLAQKNLTVARARPGQTIAVPVGYLAGRSRRFEVRAPEKFRHWPFKLRPKGPRPRWRSPFIEDEARPALPGRVLSLTHGQPVPAPGPRASGSSAAVLAITVPPDVAPGTSGVIDLVARDGNGTIVGGIAVELTVDPDTPA